MSLRVLLVLVVGGGLEAAQELVNSVEDDPFIVLPANLKNFELLGADLFFNLLVKISLYSLVVRKYRKIKSVF